MHPPTETPKLPVAAPPGHKNLPLDPIVLLLEEYLVAIGQPKALQTAVEEALKCDIPQLKAWGITSAEGFLDFANRLLKWIPHENFEGKDIYWVLCMFYFILDQVPLINLQNPIEPSQAHKPLTWLSAWIVCYAQRIGSFMDTPESITATSYQSFMNSPKFNIQECVVPPGGFKTFNELFSRQLQPGMRPIASPADDKVVVFPVDSTFDGAWNVGPNSLVNIKNIDWKIQDLLKDSKYGPDFADGIWMHTFLNTFDYHRQHAPVKGEVLEAKIIQGAAYLEVKATVDKDGKKTLAPIRRMVSSKDTAYSADDSLHSLDAPDSPGYQFNQMRGLVIIDNPVVGLVAVLPIGMAQVSSVKLSVREGEFLEKGQEISTFLFGGSDLVMVFQKKAGLQIKDFPSTLPPKHFLMGEKLVVANPQEKNGHHA